MDDHHIDLMWRVFLHGVNINDFTEDQQKIVRKAFEEGYRKGFLKADMTSGELAGDF